MTKIFGHRGCRGQNNPPENSLAAFAEAIRQGADGVEFDIFATNDSELVVFHDTKLENLTNGTGKLIAQTLSQVKELRLKKNGSNDISDQAIPTLDEVLDLVKATEKPGFVVNIEMKGMGLASQLAAIIRKRLLHDWKREQFLISSFDLNNLRDFSRLVPVVPVGVLLSGKAPSWNFSENLLIKKMPELHDLHPASIHLTLPSMTSKAIQTITDAHAKPVAWATDELHPSQLSPEARTALLNYLLQGHTLITDYPAEMRALLQTTPNNQQ